MKIKLVALVILTLVLIGGCQPALPDTFMLTPNSIAPTLTRDPIVALTQTPTSSSEPLVHQPRIISREKLNCVVNNHSAICVDNLLNIEFDYPINWGEIETELRTGGYTGHAYDYYFGGKTIAENEPLVAGGRSIDFSEGRGGMSTDFAGYGDKGLQFKGEVCDSNWNNVFPICQDVNGNVAWMIRFPKASYICESPPGFYTTPVFRIEVNLPTNSKINGFVFEAPFYSEQFLNQVKDDLYPLLGLGSDMLPTKCGELDQLAFDNQLKSFLEKINTRTIDDQTQRKIDELIHLATSIRFR